MPLNVIIIAILVLVVLIVLVFIFTGRIGKFGQTIESCQQKGGTCKLPFAAAGIGAEQEQKCGPNEIYVEDAQCTIPGQVCCIVLGK